MTGNSTSEPIREKPDKKEEDKAQQQTADNLKDAIKQRGGKPKA